MVEARKNVDFFANLKAQMWWSLRIRFQNTYRALQGMNFDPDNLISLSKYWQKCRALIQKLQVIGLLSV